MDALTQAIAQVQDAGHAVAILIVTTAILAAGMMYRTSLRGR